MVTSLTVRGALVESIGCALVVLLGHVEGTAGVLPDDDFSLVGLEGIDHLGALLSLHTNIRVHYLDFLLTVLVGADSNDLLRVAGGGDLNRFLRIDLSNGNGGLVSKDVRADLNIFG